MRIAIISNSAASLLNFRGPLLIELVRRGHEVFAFAPYDDGTTREALQSLGVHPVDLSLTRSGTNPLREFTSIIELFKLLKHYKPDVCLSYFLKPVIYGTIAAWMAGVRRRYAMIEGLGFAFTKGSNQSFRKNFLKGAISLLARVSMRRVEKIIFLNIDDQKEFIERGLVASDKAVLLGGIGVDLEEWAYSEPNIEPITFIFIGRLLLDKGVREYVESARIVRKSHPDARFLLVGGSDDNPSAIPLHEVQNWVDEGLIEWPGHVPVRPWLTRASVFVLPSYREGVPRSTQEAMAVGLPVITTDAPGCRETVVDGRNGYLVPTQNPVALAKAMQKFTEVPETIVPMGRESRRLAEERFDVHVQNRKLLQFMEIR